LPLEPRRDVERPDLADRPHVGAGERRVDGGERGVPLGRLGEAEEFADLVAFLVSERASYITGTAVNFDGGISAAI
jgi:NAD(P)-dependent dehydrogenase (short-subunit alcohol dehydrogenase family)